MEANNFLDGNSCPELLLAFPGSTHISFFGVEMKWRAIDPAVEFNSHFATRAARAIAFVKVHKGLDFTNVHWFFELDKLIVFARRRSMVFIVKTFRGPDVLKKQSLSIR